MTDSEHVMDGNMLCHSDNKGYVCLESFFYGFGRLAPGHIYCGGIWFGLLLCLCTVSMEVCPISQTSQ